MVTRIGGNRRKTRSILKKPRRQRGKISLRNYLQTFEPGTKVVLKAEPAIHKGLYFRRYHGLVGLIKEKTGTCYTLTLKDQDKEKTLVVHPVHLKRL